MRTDSYDYSLRIDLHALVISESKAPTRPSNAPPIDTEIITTKTSSGVYRGWANGMKGPITDDNNHPIVESANPAMNPATIPLTTSKDLEPKYPAATYRM